MPLSPARPERRTGGGFSGTSAISARRISPRTMSRRPPSIGTATASRIFCAARKTGTCIICAIPARNEAPPDVRLPRFHSRRRRRSGREERVHLRNRADAELPRDDDRRGGGWPRGGVVWRDRGGKARCRHLVLAAVRR